MGFFFSTCYSQKYFVKETQKANISENTLKLMLHTTLKGYLEG